MDGEWRNIKVFTEAIKIKGRSESLPFDIKYTHRGPLVDVDLLQGAEVLFSEGIPSSNNKAVYSFAWSGDIPYESTITILKDFLRATSAKEFEEKFDSMEIFASVA